MNSDHFIRLNADRGAQTVGILVDLNAIPVLTLGVCVDSKKLVIIGFHDLTKEEISERLKSFLEDIEGAEFRIAE